MSADVGFYEISAKLFPLLFPDAISAIPPEVLRDFVTDPKYIVRVSADNSKFEFGYREDRWLLK